MTYKSDALQCAICTSKVGFWHYAIHLAASVIFYDAAKHCLASLTIVHCSYFLHISAECPARKRGVAEFREAAGAAAE